MNKEKHYAIVDTADLIGDVFNIIQFPIHPVREVLVFMSCQAMLETGYLTSEVYQANFNLFGMKQPHSRPAFSYKENLNHACYHTYRHSIADYLYWQLWNGFTKDCYVDVSAFRHRLDISPFNPSKNYTSTIMFIYNQFYRYEQKEDSDR